MRPLFFGLTTLTLLACGDSTGPAGVPDSQLHIVVQDPLAPPLYAQQDTFWAHVGQDRELRMYYQGATPTQTGDEFLRFEVPGSGLKVHAQLTVLSDVRPEGVLLRVQRRRELRMYYQGATPTQTGDEFLRFEVPGSGGIRHQSGWASRPDSTCAARAAAVRATGHLLGARRTRP